jgi:hypothetical protein
VERASRWLNLQGDPIPNAFVDIVVNGTYNLPASGTTTVPVAWTGTSAVQFSDMRMGNSAIVVVAWHGDAQVTCAVVASTEPDVLAMTSDSVLEAALPDNTANFTFTLTNFLSAPTEVNITLDKPANWDASLSATSLTVPAGGEATFTLTLTGNGTSSADPVAEFTAIASGTLDPTVQARSRVQVQVKDDIAPPVVLDPEHSPAVPRADQLVNVTVTVGDNSGVASVRISYFSCTPEACSPYFMFDMNLTAGNEYATSIRPIGHDHTDLHYRIIATDVHGNELVTGLYDVELEPVEHHAAEADTAKPKWIGVVLLVVFAAIAVAVALRGRGNPPNEDKPAGGAGDAAAPSKPGVPDRAVSRARIQKAYDEGRITKDQYERNMEKFKD